MSKKILLLSILGITSSIAFAYDLPTIAVPNLVYTKIDKTPVTTTTTDSATLSSTTTTTVIKQEVQRQLPMFNADVRGALLNSKQFKVVDMPKANTLWTGNSHAVLAYVNGLNKTSTTTTPVASVVTPTAESTPKPSVATKSTESTTVTNNNPANNLPDYILLGTISSITQDADMEPLQDTNKITSQYNIDISVDYQVVGTKNNAVIASFNAYGHANDVKILNAGDTVQKQNHNIPLLINQASKDLASNVISQLQQQFSVSSKTYNIESITNLKVYN